MENLSCASNVLYYVIFEGLFLIDTRSFVAEAVSTALPMLKWKSRYKPINQKLNREDK